MTRGNLIIQIANTMFRR